MSIIVTVLSVIAALFMLVNFAEAIFDIKIGFIGRASYINVAKEIGAQKIEANRYRFMLDGAAYEYHDDASTIQLRTGVAQYFVVSTAFSQSGYLGIYQQEHARLAGKFHPNAQEIKAGDATFDQVFYTHSEKADFAAGLLASSEKRQALRSLHSLGFNEILFNDMEWYNHARNIKARISTNYDENAFDANDVTASLVLTAAKQLRVLKNV